MASVYLKIPTSVTKLGGEVSRLIDMYQIAQLPEADILEALNTWKTNVPKLLLADGEEILPNPALVRNIGKRRAMVLTTLLAK